MPSHSSFDELSLSRLKSHLGREAYAPGTIANYLATARRFRKYLADRDITVEAVEPSDVSRFLRRELRRYRQRYGHPPRSSYNWRSQQVTCIHMLLRVVQGRWPPVSGSLTPLEAFQQQVCQEYGEWLSTVRGLAVLTIQDRCEEAKRFLTWLGERGGPDQLLRLTVSVIDAYLTLRMSSSCRRSRQRLAVQLRSILRYLHATKRIACDLAPVVITPKLYAFEGIPSALRAEEVQAVLQATRQDHRAKGLRDYAILLLLSTYGLREAELIHLRLEDIDWREETVRIRHCKTGAESRLPLLHAVGEAILVYLRNARPKSRAREIFISAYAPYQRLSRLYQIIQVRLQAAGVHPAGKKGSHAFRHARAISLLRAAVPAKQIGDILGHRSLASTAVYLKLATQDLRAVALEIPGQVNS
jgi:integrase/recombinase XerD